MQFLNILIVEDEILIAEDIKQTLEGVGYQNVFRSQNYDQALKLLHLNNIDLVMLDINLNGKQTGIDLAEFINKNKKIPFIFLTSYSDKETIEAVKHTKPSGFLLKPYQENLLLASIEIALFSYYSSKNLIDTSNFDIQQDTVDLEFIVNGKLVVKDKKNFIKIPLDEIFWFESDKNYIDIKTADRKYTIRSSLKNLMLNLPPSFIKCHRQYVINKKYVTGFNSNFISIGDFKIPLSRNEQEMVLRMLKM